MGRAEVGAGLSLEWPALVEVVEAVCAGSVEEVVMVVVVAVVVVVEMRVDGKEEVTVVVVGVVIHSTWDGLVFLRPPTTLFSLILPRLLLFPLLLVLPSFTAPALDCRLLVFSSKILWVLFPATLLLMLCDVCVLGVRTGESPCC